MTHLKSQKERGIFTIYLLLRLCVYSQCKVREIQKWRMKGRSCDPLSTASKRAKIMSRKSDIVAEVSVPDIGGRLCN